MEVFRKRLGQARVTVLRLGMSNPTPVEASSEARGGQSFSYDKKKYPNRQTWEIAVQRVERAIRYAKMFPNLTKPDDLKFQTLDWQYENQSQGWR